MPPAKKPTTKKAVKRPAAKQATKATKTKSVTITPPLVGKTSITKVLGGEPGGRVQTAEGWERARERELGQKSKGASRRRKPKK